MIRWRKGVTLVVAIGTAACGGSAEMGDLQAFCGLWADVAPGVDSLTRAEQVGLLTTAPPEIDDWVGIVVASVQNDAGGRTAEAIERTEAFVADHC